MKRLLAAAFLALSLIGPSTSRAQATIGGQVDYGQDTDFGVGGRIELGLPTVAPVRLVGSFDYFFPDRDELDYWEANANLTFTKALRRSSLWPYFGGGLNLAHSDLGNRSRTEAGANVLVGIKYVGAPAVPFAELRAEIFGGEQFVLTGGLLFLVGPSP